MIYLDYAFRPILNIKLIFCIIFLLNITLSVLQPSQMLYKSYAYLSYKKLGLFAINIIYN